MNNNTCITKILEAINVLQNQAEKCDDIPNTCDRPFLGFSNSSNTFVYNTRPITFYNRDNELITISYTDENNVTQTSSTFRIENVNGCCITCRILAPNPDTTSIFPYVATDEYVTFNCNCICALQCLNDTFIDCL